MPRPSRTRPRRSLAPALAALTGVALLAGAAVGVMGAREPGADPSGTPASSPTSQADDAPAGEAPAARPSATPASSPSPSPTADDLRFTVVAAGDVLPHTPVIDSARTPSGYDFAALMRGAGPLIAGADLALCHLEVPISPAGVEPSGYPLFSAPAALATGLSQVGWDGCSTASNHSVDRGSAGVAATLAALDEAGLQATGTARNEAEAGAAFYRVRSGERTVTVAHVSFSYGTNGMPVASPWEVNLIDAEAPDATPVIAAAARARAQGADIVLASVHCCVEYTTAPSDAQRALAEQIAASGEVDLYIGHHAHVPQPIEQLPGGPGGTGMWTAFGLGNFLSNQSPQCCVPETQNGVLLSATFTVGPAGRVTVDVEWTGTTVDRLGGHRVYPLTSLKGGAGTLSRAELEERRAAVRAAVGDAAPERLGWVQPLADDVKALPRP